MSKVNWFYIKDGVQFGPVGEEELKEKIASGELSQESYVWNESFEDWEMAFTALELWNADFLPPPPSHAIPAAEQTRPWARYWARQLDLLIFAFFLVFLLPFSTFSTPLAFTVILLFSWIFGEALLLSTWGTTPGKWFFKISLRKLTGEKISFSDALKRSFSLWFFGMGCGLPFVSLIAMALSYKRLQEKKETSWDKEGDFIVTHKRLGRMRSLVIFFFLLSFFLMLLTGNSDTDLDPESVEKVEIPSLDNYA